MTTQQIILWSCAYLVELVAVTSFMRATARRIVGGIGRWSCCRFAGAGRDHSVRSPGLVANTICLDAILSTALLLRALNLAGVNLPRHLATGPLLRLARLSGVCCRRCGHWPAT